MNHHFVIFSEGEYTFERNKPFIPIQVEPRYNPYGWLGLMCGSMYRYSMVKPERYESDMTNLFTKIQEIVRGEPGDQPDNPTGIRCRAHRFKHLILNNTKFFFWKH